MKVANFIIFLVIFVLLSPLTTSGLVLYQEETIKDRKNDLNLEGKGVLPADKYLDSIDIDNIGYKVDISSGMFTLSSSFYGDRVSDGNYQLQYRFYLDLTSQIYLEIECLELLQTNADETSACMVSFWEQSLQNSSSYRYYSQEADYIFAWEDRDISWSFNLDEILQNESKTQVNLSDIFSKPSTQYPFDTNEVRVPLLDVSMAVSVGSSDQIADTLFRPQEDTSSAALFAASNWIYGVILLVVGGILVIKREKIASFIRRQ